MKFTFLYLLFLASVISVCGLVYKNAVGITHNRSAATLKCTKSGPVCADDCTTLMLCSSFRCDPIRTITCTAPNPYCVDGACASNPGSCKRTAGSTFECTDVGIFPDPSDCTQFHVCDAGSPHSYKCIAGFVFNSKLKMCQMGRAPCTKISCTKASEANTFMSYASNPAYYAFCTKDNSGFDLIMFRCPNEEFEEFDVKTKACKFKCKTRGYFQNPEDCAQYFYCSGVNAQPILSECPENRVFDGIGCVLDADKCQYKPQRINGGGGGLIGPNQVDQDVSA